MSEEATFLFADLAGYTALTEAHGDERAADLAEAFCERVCSIEGELGGSDVKTLGDAVMSRVPDAGEAIRLGVRIVDEIGRSHGFPAVRVGMHHGPAVRRGDDWFGSTVNLASRVADVAEAGQVLLTDAVRAAADVASGIVIRPFGEQSFKNVSMPVELWTASSDRPLPLLPVDPVCRMVLDPDQAARHMDRDGRNFWFCSDHCAETFEQASRELRG